MLLQTSMLHILSFISPPFYRGWLITLEFPIQLLPIILVYLLVMQLAVILRKTD